MNKRGFFSSLNGVLAFLGLALVAIRIWESLFRPVRLRPAPVPASPPSISPRAREFDRFRRFGPVGLLLALSLVLPLIKDFDLPPVAFWSLAWQLWPLIFTLTAIALLGAMDALPRGLWTFLLWLWPVPSAVLVLAAAAALQLLPSGYWSVLLQLWPSAPLLAGVTLVTRRQGAMARWGLQLAIIVAAIGGSWIYGLWAESRFSTQITVFEFPLGEERRAHLELNLGIDGIRTAGGSLTDQLFFVELVERTPRDLLVGRPGSARYDPAFNRVDGVPSVRFEHSTDQAAAPAFIGRREALWRFDLNPNVAYSIVLNGGVGESSLDLSQLKIENLVVNAGVGKADIVFPANGGHMRASIDGGIGQVSIRLPAGVAARIDVEPGLGALQIAERYRPLSANSFESEGYNIATNRVELKVQVGVGPVTIG